MSRNSVFICSADRDLGVAFKVHPGNQASSRVEAKNSALLWSCERYLLEPIEWPKGSQASCGVLREDSISSLSSAGKEGPHLVMKGESRSLLLAAGQHVGFLSSYDRELRELLVLPQGSPVSIRVARGSVALLSSHSRGIVPQNTLKGESRGLSRIAAGNPGFPDL